MLYAFSSYLCLLCFNSKGWIPLEIGVPSKVATKAIAFDAMAVVARVPRHIVWPWDGPPSNRMTCCICLVFFYTFPYLRFWPPSVVARLVVTSRKFKQLYQSKEGWSPCEFMNFIWKVARGTPWGWHIVNPRDEHAFAWEHSLIMLSQGVWIARLHFVDREVAQPYEDAPPFTSAKCMVSGCRILSLKTTNTFSMTWFVTTNGSITIASLKRRC